MFQKVVALQKFSSHTNRGKKMKLTTFMTWMSFTLSNHILPTGVIAVKVSINKTTLNSFQEAFKFKFFLISLFLLP